VEPNKARPAVVMTTGRAFSIRRGGGCGQGLRNSGEPIRNPNSAIVLPYEHSSFPAHPQIDCCGVGFAVSVAV